MKKLRLTLPLLAICLLSGTTAAQFSNYNYSDWAATHLADHPNESEPFDDPGGFGVPNLARYAFALEPLAPIGSPVQQIHASENGLFSLSFYRYEGIGDVDYTIEAKEDLTAESWTPIALDDLEPEIVSLGDGREQVLVASTLKEVNRGFFRIRADLADTPENILFYEDFESYMAWETPSREWHTDIPAYSTIYVQGDPGSQYLTMTDVNPTSVASLVRNFDMQEAESVSVTFEWYRTTGPEFNNHLGEELRVPALVLLRDIYDPPGINSANVVAQFVFRSWNRGTVWLRDTSDDLPSVAIASSDFDHNDPLKMRMTYRRAGEIIVEASKDDFATIEWSITRPTIPDMDVNAAAIRSSNRAHATTRYADPVWELRSVLATSK
ncbi:MAG TPA: hypothetical protein VK041_07290 [Opitutales bacterium]|nr:hypothetical protein [Opitutales bacterium]